MTQSPQNSSNRPQHFFTPKRQLGQNFLVDPNIKSRIIDACDLKPDETILEIGPGMGALTKGLAPHVGQIIAVETDKRLSNQLTEEYADQNVTVIHADFLKYNLDQLPDNLKAIGNLPYYISTPIIERILLNPKKFASLYITVQYELAERIVAKPNSKTYGSFTCFVQYYGAPKKLFKIKNTAFRPTPKVDSCFLKIDRKPSTEIPATDESFLFKIIQQAFQQRRKTILNSLSTITTKQSLDTIFNDLSIDPRFRAENLTLQNYVDITNRLLEIKES